MQIVRFFAALRMTRMMKKEGVSADTPSFFVDYVDITIISRSSLP